VCPRDLAAARRKEKQPGLVEYDIQVAAFEACPSGVVKPYEHIRCVDFIAPSAMNMANVQNSLKYDKSKQSVLFMELCEGSLEDLLREKGNDTMLRDVISSVLKTLNKINKKYPDFRHNDLWAANVMVSKRGFLFRRLWVGPSSQNRNQSRRKHRKRNEHCWKVGYRPKNRRPVRLSLFSE
jgi:hypothetical protein